MHPLVATKPSSEIVLTMVPLLFRSSGSAYFAHRNAPRRFTSSTVSQSATHISSALPLMDTPALLHSVSRPPKVTSTNSISLHISSSLRTSHGKKRTRSPYSSRSRLSALSPRIRPEAAITTFAPSARKARAAANPMPLVPPVTRIVLF